jgi:hypothetical protein
MFSYAAQHGPICMILLEQEARLACTFSEGGLTMALVFDPPIACRRESEATPQHPMWHDERIHFSRHHHTNIDVTRHGVSSQISIGTGSWKKQPNKETLRR